GVALLVDALIDQIPAPSHAFLLQQFRHIFWRGQGSAARASRRCSRHDDREKERRGVHSASAPEMISTSSVVIAAWRCRLYWIDRRLIMSPALRVALSMAVMRLPCSDAAFSSIARKIWTAMLRGSK